MENPLSALDDKVKAWVQREIAKATLDAEIRSLRLIQDAIDLGIAAKLETLRQERKALDL